MTTELRDVALTGVYNVRDLGGLMCRDGRVTRRGVFLRGDSPHQLTTIAQDTLLTRYQVQTVIDLRSMREVVQHPNPFGHDARVQYLSAPLQTTGVRMFDLRQITQLHLYYQYLLHTAPNAFYAVFMTLASAPATTYFHCRIGKDRTGIVASLLLDLVGVPLDVIIDDYVQTTGKIVPLIAQYAHERPFFVRKSLYEGLFEARAETMHRFWRHVHAQYGDAYGYLVSIGIQTSHIDALRHKFVQSHSPKS